MCVLIELFNTAPKHKGKCALFWALARGQSLEPALRLSSSIPFTAQSTTIVALVDPTTSKGKECYRYTAFGEREIYDDTGTSLSKSTLYNPWGFASKRHDAETGFVYFSRRYFAQEQGRWITPDPLGFADGPNLYAYVHNNPLTRFDLYGLYEKHEIDYLDDDTFLESVFDQYCSIICSHYSEVAKSGGDFGRSLYEHPVDAVQGMYDSVASKWLLANSLTANKVGEGIANTVNGMVDFCKNNNADTIAAHFLASITPGPENFLKNPKLFLKGSEAAIESVTKEAGAAKVLSKTKKLEKNGLKNAKNSQYTKSSLQRGQAMHKDYMANEALNQNNRFLKEHRLPSGNRPDVLDMENHIIYELKPNNPRGIRQGKKQLEKYKKELDNNPRYGGEDWKTHLDTY